MKKTSILILCAFFANSLLAQSSFYNGKWIITKCISSDAGDEIENSNDINGFLGHILELNKSSKEYHENIYGSENNFSNVDFSILKQPTKNLFISKQANHIGIKVDSLYTLYLKGKGLMTMLVFLTNDEMVIQDKEFIFYANKITANFNTKVVHSKSFLYTNYSLQRRFNYYVVKSDSVTVLLQKGNSYFVKYVSANKKDFYGWISSKYLN